MIEGVKTIKLNGQASGIINTLDLEKPIYSNTTNYGHFGKVGLPWEKIIQIY